MDPLAYPKSILAGEIPAGRTLRAAAKRCLDDHQRYAVEGEWVYTPGYVAPVLAFLACCPHVKARWGRDMETLRLSPWQEWIVSEVYGWRRRENLSERRFTEVLVEVGKKNGKTHLAAAIALYELCYGDAGAEVYSVATKRDQSKIVWEIAAGMIPGLRKISGEKKLSRLRVLRGKYMIKLDDTASFVPLGRDVNPQDGPNPSFVIVDEAAAVQDRSIIESMHTALAARERAWMLYITTAQLDTSTLYFEKRELARSALEGADVDISRVFAALYCLDPAPERESSTADPGDDWHDESVWVKANPNIDVSVRRSFLATQVVNADNIASRRATVLAKHFGLFSSGGDDPWLEDMRMWRATAVDPRELDRRGPMVQGFDLAQIRNLCSGCRLWVTGRERYTVEFMNWICAEGLKRVPKQFRWRYDEALDTGILAISGDRTVDYEPIDQWAREGYEQYYGEAIGIDPYNANELANAWEEDGLEVVMVRQGIAHMSSASKSVERMILGGMIAHNGDQFIDWQFENARAYQDVNHNLKVRRSLTSPERQVDAPISLIIAASVADLNAEVEAGPQFSFRKFQGAGESHGPSGRFEQPRA